MSIERLEDLRLWQEARVLNKMVYEYTKNFPKEEKYNFRHHMRECSRNTMGNIGEAFGRFHFQESMQFYRIARGSINELKSDSYGSFDVGYIEKINAQKLLKQINLVIKMLNQTIKTTPDFKNNSITK